MQTLTLPQSQAERGEMTQAASLGERDWLSERCERAEQLNRQMDLERDILQRQIGTLLLRIQESDLAYAAIMGDVDSWRERKRGAS